MAIVGSEYSKYQRQSVTELVARHALGEDYFGQTSSATYPDVRNKIAQLTLPKDAYILDAGCGNGCFALKLIKDFSCRILGVDTSDEVISEANKAAAVAGAQDKLSFRVADFSKLDDIPDGVFDLILCIGSLYWNKDNNEILLIWRKKLTNKGKILVYSNMQVESLSKDEIELIGNTKFISFDQFVHDLKMNHLFLVETIDQTEEYIRWIKRWCEGLDLHQNAMKEKMGLEGFVKFAERFKMYRQLAETAKVKRLILIAMCT